MTKPNFEDMSLQELREYILEHRNDEDKDRAQREDGRRKKYPLPSAFFNKYFPS